jgi:predicted  nucleic acid-binding Zn-ribbon protein
MNATLLSFANSQNTHPDSRPAPSPEFISRLEARLAFLNEQIIKLSALAAKAGDEEEQEKYWSAAQDASREARELWKYLKSVQQQS